MRTTKRTEIMLEAKQVIVIRSPHRRVRFWCSGCAEATEMITPELASVLSNAPPRMIYRWIEDGKLHFTEIKDGRLLVCRNSLDLTVAAAAANPSFVASANLTTRP